MTQAAFQATILPMIPDPRHSPITLPAIPALFANARGAFILTTEGEILALAQPQAKMMLHTQSVLVCHAPYMRARLGRAEFHAFDVLELFAFVHPRLFCVPTPHGLCTALGIPAPEMAEDIPPALFDITRTLLADLRKDPYKDKADPLNIARIMGLNGKGWSWTPFIFSALGAPYDAKEPLSSKTALSVWKHLPEWAEEAPQPPPSHFGVDEEETRARLQKILGFESENRTEQVEYALGISKMFEPPAENTPPHIVLAEAGTGVGKTLGYLAPASLWAEKNQGTVWISTYTKNLQRQIGQELDRLYPDSTLKATHVATRKGRENYLCLLNLEDAAGAAGLSAHIHQAVGAGIMARWAAATTDGDLSGAEFPGWLPGLLGYAHTGALADRRGECVFGACDHYKKCFVEHAVRKAKHARIVVANHALVMISAALSGAGDEMPARYIFDEGHHLFEAADSAFSAHLSATETRDFRRWILGLEGGGRRSSRARGLKKRAEDLCEGMAEAEELLRKILSAAECLTADNWTRRLKDGAPSGPTEHFLAQVHAQVMSRAEGVSGPYSLETEVFPTTESLLERARVLKTELKKLQKPMQDLSKLFRKKLGDDEGHLESETRKRLESMSVSLERRASFMLQSWIGMLEDLDHMPDTPSKKTEGYISWMGIERDNGQAFDVGLYRHFIDPMKPFAESLRPHLHGMAVTSATLRDTDAQNDWATARARTGAVYLSPQSHNIALHSPFDYAKRTKIYVLNDVNKNDLAQVAGATRALFEAAGGGALGLFTAISRLRAVHERIALPLEERGLPLYAQHVDDIDTGTLVDMFREDLHACLLGTDAMRDGVDVPGESLRLIVFDRVPWPRPTILHKARRDAFAEETGDKRGYDEMLTRLKLKQAFGRLIRRKDDRGVFVMMDSSLPTRLQSAFPPDVEIIKTGLADAVAGIKAHLSA